MKLTSCILESIHRGERVVSKTHSQVGERKVASVQVEALIGPKHLIAHSRREAGNAYKGIRVVQICPSATTLVVYVFKLCLVSVPGREMGGHLCNVVSTAVKKSLSEFF